jgi:hypothetical protein
MPNVYQSVADELGRICESVTVANGYNCTVAAVHAYIPDYADVKGYPALCYALTGADVTNDKSNNGRVEKIYAFEVFGYLHCEYATDSMENVLRFAADFEKALATDMRTNTARNNVKTECGADLILWSIPNFTFASDTELKAGQFTATFAAQVRHDYNQP